MIDNATIIKCSEFLGNIDSTLTYFIIASVIICELLLLRNLKMPSVKEAVTIKEKAIALVKPVAISAGTLFILTLAALTILRTISSGYFEDSLSVANNIRLKCEAIADENSDLYICSTPHEIVELNENLDDYEVIIHNLKEFVHSDFFTKWYFKDKEDLWETQDLVDSFDDSYQRFDLAGFRVRYEAYMNELIRKGVASYFSKLESETTEDVKTEDIVDDIANELGELNEEEGQNN